jgi:hypothetical protein
METYSDLFHVCECNYVHMGPRAPRQCPACDGGDFVNAYLLEMMDKPPFAQVDWD